MRAFLVMLMLTLLPLQFSAAAAVECCDHMAIAKGAQAQRHQSPHLLTGSDMGELDFNGLGLDLDCGTCHANCAVAMAATAEFMIALTGLDLFEHRAEFNLPPWHERPYRPKWSSHEIRG